MSLYKKCFLLISALGLLLLSCSASNPQPENKIEQDAFAKLPKNTEGLVIATFAGGCFWCTEAIFERVKGVKHVISGYAGGSEKYPTYKTVSSGKTSHAEAIQIYYDPNIISFKTLLDVFFKSAHDPTQLNRQGPDVGTQYRSIVFYRNQDEKEKIEQEIVELETTIFEKEIVTEVMAFEKFYPAEQYHQDYYESHQDNSYVYNVSRPKVLKFEKNYPDLLKAEYQKN